jgi:MerR family transcriptional regulator, light-induced transcriptional regulator
MALGCRYIPEKEGRATLTINEAATVLNVSADILRLWEQRYGFPAPARTPDGRDEYDRDQMIDLRNALQNSRSITHAVVEARATRGRGPRPAA